MSNVRAFQSIEQQHRQRKAREDAAFSSLKELYARQPQEAIAILGKIQSRQERCKVMLAIGIIDHIEGE